MDALLFDMDGVVVDSERYWVEREAEDIFPRTVAAEVDPHDITGMNVADLYDHLDDRYETTVTKAEFLSIYDDHASDIYRERVSLHPSFADAAMVGRNQGAHVGLVSSSPVRWIEMVVDRFGLERSLDEVVSADHVERGKPAPDVYALAAERLDVAPEGCVAVEDSAHGIAAANAAGMRTVGLLTDTNDRATLDAADAIATAADLPDRL